MRDRSELEMAVVGTSFREAGFEGLSRFVLPSGARDDLLRLRTACGAEEIVYVATCNRVEIYLTFAPGARPGAAALAQAAADFFAAPLGPLVVREGLAAIEHLFSVAASLESLVFGESEIAGQVRRAAERARALGIDGPRLRRAFERAAAVAKRVRSETAIGRTPVSVASLCLRAIESHFAGRAPGQAVLVGVGDMTRKVGLGLRERGARLLVVNRTIAHAEALAAEVGGRAISLEAFREAPPPDLDVLVAAAGAPGVVPAWALAPALAARCGAGRRDPLLVCDLGVPRNVEPGLDRDPRMRLITMPDLEALAARNRARRAGEVEAALAIVRAEVASFAREERLRAVAAESVEALLLGSLGHLPPSEKTLLRGFAVRLAERLARQPCV